jgi:hypothetical protein
VYPLGILTDPVHDLSRWAKGIRSAGSGDSVGALHHLAKFRLPVLARMSAAERIEAAVRAGDLAAARRWTDELTRFADATSRPWALATVVSGFGPTGLLGFGAEITTRRIEVPSDPHDQRCRTRCKPTEPARLSWLLMSGQVLRRGMSLPMASAA